MPRSKRLDQATLEDTLTPPTMLPPTQTIAHFQRAAGKNLYTVTIPSTIPIPEALLSDDGSREALVEMPSKFRSTVWLRRGGFVVVELKHLKTSEVERDNKIAGEIVNVVGDEKAWRRAAWWPKDFARNAAPTEDHNGQGRVGELPPSEDEEDV